MSTLEHVRRNSMILFVALLAGKVNSSIHPSTTRWDWFELRAGSPIYVVWMWSGREKCTQVSNGRFCSQKKVFLSDRKFQTSVKDIKRIDEVFLGILCVHHSCGGISRSVDKIWHWHLLRSCTVLLSARKTFVKSSVLQCSRAYWFMWHQALRMRGISEWYFERHISFMLKPFAGCFIFVNEAAKWKMVREWQRAWNKFLDGLNQYYSEMSQHLAESNWHA